MTVVPAATAAEPAAEKAPRRYRELNDADREKMERLEQTANKERTRAAELERELQAHQGPRRDRSSASSPPARTSWSW